jgi:streptomycin 6-kinase
MDRSGTEDVGTPSSVRYATGRGAGEDGLRTPLCYTLRMHIPEIVRTKAQVAGVAGWLDTVPELAERLAAEWAFNVGEVLEGGTESVVIAVTRSDGDPAVLKLIVPRNAAARNEITALRIANGRGCARLLAADEAHSALLLERLGPPLFELGLPLLRRHEVLAATARRVWRPAPESGLPTGAQKGRWLIDFIEAKWEHLDRPCSERAAAYAIECAERRIAAHDDERAVLVHGDVHEWNTLEAGDGFKLIDPDGLLAEAEYDMGIIMREDPVELLQGDPWERAHRLARLTDLDPIAIWEWGVVERVSTGLLCTEIDLQPVGRQMLNTADAVSRR